MAQITAAMVKQLREMTDSPMMECKKALVEADGDMDAAVDVLRKNGLAKAAKKAGRETNEGAVAAYISEDGKTGALVELSCETDFVASNPKFTGFASSLAKVVADVKPADVEALLAAEMNGETVEAELTELIHVIGENMKIRRYEKMTAANGFVASYIHAGGKIGVLVDVETDVVNDEIREMAKNVAMQAAALKPLYTNRDEVDADYIEKEKEILTVAAKNEKPDANDKIISGMVMGRINKELKEICLLDQVYVKAEDGKQSVSQYVAQVAKANNAKVAIKKFVRFETGEGLEKKEENFADEVAKQMGM